MPAVSRKRWRPGLVGAYHFGVNADVQRSAVLSLNRKPGPQDCCLDFEENPSTRFDSASGTIRHEVYNQTGRILFYSDALRKYAGSGQIPFGELLVFGAPNMAFLALSAPTWPTWTMWQYTESGSVRVSALPVTGYLQWQLASCPGSGVPTVLARRKLCARDDQLTSAFPASRAGARQIQLQERFIALHKMLIQ